MYRIKKLSKKKGIGVGQLADLIGVTQPSMSRIISGGDTTTTVLKKIAAVLETDVKDLFVNEALNGFIETEGVVHKIESKDDLKNLLELIESNEAATS